MFPDKPIAMLFKQDGTTDPVTYSWDGVLYNIDGFRKGWWISNHQFGGYPEEGAFWKDRPHVEAYAAQLPREGDPAAVIDFEQWQWHVNNVGDEPEDTLEVMTNVVRWIRPYAVGPILFADLSVGQEAAYGAEGVDSYPDNWGAAAFISAWLEDPPPHPDIRAAMEQWFLDTKPFWEMAGAATTLLGHTQVGHEHYQYDLVRATRVMLDQLAPDLPLYVWTNGVYGHSGSPLPDNIIADTLNVIATARGTPAVWGQLAYNRAMIEAIQKSIL